MKHPKPSYIGYVIAKWNQFYLEKSFYWVIIWKKFGHKKLKIHENFPNISSSSLRNLSAQVIVHRPSTKDSNNLNWKPSVIAVLWSGSASSQLIPDNICLFSFLCLLYKQQNFKNLVLSELLSSSLSQFTSSTKSSSNNWTHYTSLSTLSFMNLPLLFWMLTPV